MSSQAAVDTPRTALASVVRERPWPLIVWIAMTGWSLVLFTVVRSNFFEFRLQRFDLGNMVQAVWSTAQGRPLETTLGTGEQVERLASHFDPILVLLAPLWLLAPTPLTLAAVQIAACALGALPVFWLARRHLGSERSAGFLALTYLAYPWLVWTALDAMHPVTFAIPLFLFAIWFLDSGRTGAFAVVALLIVGTGELMALPLAPLGLWYWLSHGHRRAGIAIAAASVAWTVICVKLVIPYFWRGESQFYAYYEAVGGSPEEVVRTAVSDPTRILAALTTPRDLLYVFALAVPLGGTFVLAPSVAIAALPQLIANCLSSVNGTTDPRGHHIAAVIPFLIAGSIFGLARISGERRARLVAATLVLTSVVSFLVGPWPGLPGHPFASAAQSRTGTRPAPYREALRAAVELIPAGAPVAATNRAGSHLSARRYFFSVPRIGQARWVILDLNDPWVPLPPRTRVRASWGRSDPGLLRALKVKLDGSPRWEKLFDRRNVSVFRRSPHVPLDMV